MAWFCLVVAGLLEIVWALALKSSRGFTRPWPTVVFLVALAGSMWLLASAARTLPIGTAYAVWVGIGAFGAALGGVLLLGEPLGPVRIGLLALLLAAIAGLKLTTPDTP